MSGPKWLVFLLGLFGVGLAAKNAVAGPAEAVPGPSAPAAGSKWPYELEVRAAAEIYGVDADLVAAVISWEQRSSTRWDPRATNPSDPSYGLGQVTPYIGVRFGIIATADDFRELYVPEKNTRAVAAFLDYLLNEKKYPLDQAVQMYNLGEPKFWNGCRVIEYLDGVMGYYKKFKAVS
jgi:soluble lytic murein transglycosylase-like protein